MPEKLWDRRSLSWFCFGAKEHLWQAELGDETWDALDKQFPGLGWPGPTPAQYPADAQLDCVRRVGWTPHPRKEVRGGMLNLSFLQYRLLDGLSEPGVLLSLEGICYLHSEGKFASFLVHDLFTFSFLQSRLLAGGWTPASSTRWPEILVMLACRTGCWVLPASSQLRLCREWYHGHPASVAPLPKY